MHENETDNAMARGESVRDGDGVSVCWVINEGLLFASYRMCVPTEDNQNVPFVSHSNQNMQINMNVCVWIEHDFRYKQNSIQRANCLGKGFICLP